MFKSKRMKKLSTILIWFTIAIATVHIVLFAYLNVSGKSMVVKYVKENFSADANLDSVSFAFPFTVVIKNFKSKDLSFSRADISMLWYNPFNSHIFLNWVYLDDLKFKVDISKDKISIEPVFVKEFKPAEDNVLQASQLPSEDKKSKSKNINLTIRKFSVRNASIEIADLTKETPVVFILKNFNLQLGHFVYPKLEKFYINMDASLVKQDITVDNFLTMKGWVDYSGKNMSVKFKINGADYFLFVEYYPPFWKPDNLGIKDAKLSLDTMMNSLNNDLTIEAVLSLDNIEFVENAQDNSRASTIKTMIALFKGDNDKPTLPIKLKTKMDSFSLDFSSLQSEFKGKMKLDIGTIVFNILDKAKSRVTETTKDVKAVTVDKAVDTTKDAVGIVKDVTVDKTIETIKGVVGTIEDVIKSQKEEKAKKHLQSETEQLSLEGTEGAQQLEIESEENIPAQTEQLEQNNNQNQNVTESLSVNTEVQNQTQSAQSDMQAENIIQSEQLNTQNQNQTQGVQ